jgi:hypothetical protein
MISALCQAVDSDQFTLKMLSSRFIKCRIVVHCAFCVICAVVSNFENPVMHFFAYARATNLYHIPIYILDVLGAVVHLFRALIFTGKKDRTNHYYI